MVNGVPREVPRPKPEGPRDFFHWRQTQPLPREYHGQYAGHGFPILVELNPNILVRDVEIMVYVFCFISLC